MAKAKEATASSEAVASLKTELADKDLLLAVAAPLSVEGIHEQVCFSARSAIPGSMWHICRTSI